MKFVIQRVQKAHVSVDDKVVGEIGPGAVVLCAFHKDDSAEQIPKLVDKLIHLRFFADDNGKMNRSLLDTNGSLLLISQFTLYANCKTGRRPSFEDSAPGEKAQILYEQLIKECKLRNINVQSGIFAAHMQVSLINDGPVTLILEDK